MSEDKKEWISFPSYKRFLTPLQETTFVNIAAKEVIAHNDKCSPLATMLSVLFNDYTLFLQRYSIFCKDVFKVVYCRCVVNGKSVFNDQYLMSSA